MSDMPSTAVQQNYVSIAPPVGFGRGASPPRVGVVIVTYNSLSDVERCIESLAQIDYENFFTVIVDNQSPDGSGEQIRRRFSGPKMIAISNPENRGFAAGNNIGIRNAIAHGADYVWLLNADTTVLPDTLSALVQTAQADPQRGAVGSKVFYGDAGEPTETIWSAGGILDPSTQHVEMRGCGQADADAFGTSGSCDYVPGCSLLVHRRVIDAVGLMPEEYFMYFEETEWCIRMQNAGFQNWYEPSSQVFHHFSDAKMQSPFTIYYYNRNRRLFWSRCSATVGARRGVFWKTLFVELPQAFRAMRSCTDAEQRKVFQAHVWSCIDFLLGRDGKRR